MVCEICRKRPHKYTCPGCLLKTCSLPCVKQHKHDSMCSGKRDKTKFVALKEFSEADLLSDYRILEETDRVVDTAHRDKLRHKHKLPRFVSVVSREARRRGVNLKLLPYPLSKRKHNTTYYNFKTQKLQWHTEWLFTEAQATFKHKFNDDVILKDALLHFIHPSTSDAVIRHRLQQYIVVISNENEANTDVTKMAKTDNAGTTSELNTCGVLKTDHKHTCDAQAETETCKLEYREESVSNRHTEEVPDLPSREESAEEGVINSAMHSQLNLDQIGLFMKREDLPTNQTRYYKLCINSSITENLNHKVIVEYPTIHVAFKKHWHQFPVD